MIQRIDRVDLSGIKNHELDEHLNGSMSFEIKTQHEDDELIKQFYINTDTHVTMETIEKVFGEIMTLLQFQDIEKLQLNVNIERFNL